MGKIIGNTTATPNPKPDWNQTDETKADYIKNKPEIIQELDLDITYNPKQLYNANAVNEIGDLISNHLDNVYMYIDDKIGIDDVVHEFNNDDDTYDDYEVYSAKAINNMVSSLSDSLEEKENKINVIDDTSTEIQYPSAKAVYDFGVRILNEISGGLDVVSALIGGAE